MSLINCSPKLGPIENIKKDLLGEHTNLLSDELEDYEKPKTFKNI